MDPITSNIDNKLRIWQLVCARDEGSRARSLANEIYKLIFSNDIYNTLWDEKVLLGLERLLDSTPPSSEVYGKEVQILRDRVRKVRDINDLFYKILDPAIEADDLIEFLANFVRLSHSAKERLRSEGRLTGPRKSLGYPSQAIHELLQYLRDELQVALENISPRSKAVFMQCSNARK